MNNNQDELIISTPTFIKVAYFTGLIMFLALSCGFGIFCYESFIAKNLGGIIITGLMCVFLLSVCYYVFILIKYQNVQVRLADDFCTIINKNNKKTFMRYNGLKFKDHKFFQVLELIDSKEQRLVMVDYYIPKFDLLQEMLNKKISN